MLAGTSIGLEIYETKKISYSVGDISVEYTKVKTKKQESKCKSYTCEYSCTYKGAPKQTITKTVNAGYSCSNGNSKSTMHSCVNTHQTAKCTGYTNDWTETNEIINNTTYTNENNGYVKECLEYAVEKAKQEANADTPSTYSIKIPNSNDATASGTTTIQGKTVDELYNTYVIGLIHSYWGIKKKMNKLANKLTVLSSFSCTESSEKYNITVIPFLTPTEQNTTV